MFVPEPFQRSPQRGYCHTDGTLFDYDESIVPLSPFKENRGEA